MKKGMENEKSDYVQSDNGKMRKLKPKSEAKLMDIEEDYSLPRISFTHEQLPEMKDWKIGEKYTLEVEVELDNIGKHSGTLIIKAVKTS